MYKYAGNAASSHHTLIILTHTGIGTFAVSTEQAHLQRAAAMPATPTLLRQHQWLTPQRFIVSEAGNKSWNKDGLLLIRPHRAANSVPH